MANEPKRYWIEQAPEIEIDERGLVHVLDTDREEPIERVMSIESLREYVRRGHVALDAWAERSGG